MSTGQGYARALGFENSDGLCRAVGQALETGNVAELESRHNDAVRRLFSELHYDRSSPEALEEAIIEMANAAPGPMESLDYETGGKSRS